MKQHTLMLATLALGIAIGSFIVPTDVPNSVNAAPAATGEVTIEKYAWWKNNGSQFVFFAVLEGLYEDGVRSDVVDVVIPLVTPSPTDTNPAPQPRRDTHTNFIYTCPLCHPAAEAFLIYASRKPFRGQKTTGVDTFGTGLPAELVKKLKSEKPTVRRGAIQVLIQTWVQRRIERSKMTDAQRSKLTIELKLLKAAGLKSLEMFKQGKNGDYFKELYGTWKSCPVCEGGFGACAAPDSKGGATFAPRQSSKQTQPSSKDASSESTKPADDSVTKVRKEVEELLIRF